MVINTATIECQGCKGMFSTINAVLEKESLKTEKELCDHCLQKESADHSKYTVIKALSEEYFDSLVSPTP